MTDPVDAEQVPVPEPKVPPCDISALVRYRRDLGWYISHNTGDHDYEKVVAKVTNEDERNVRLFRLSDAKPAAPSEPSEWDAAIEAAAQKLERAGYLVEAAANYPDEMLRLFKDIRSLKRPAPPAAEPDEMERRYEEAKKITDLHDGPYGLSCAAKRSGDVWLERSAAAALIARLRRERDEARKDAENRWDRGFLEAKRRILEIVGYFRERIGPCSHEALWSGVERLEPGGGK